MEKAETTISIAAPFGLKATALGHGWHECTPMTWCEGGECLQVIERDGAMAVRLSLTDKGERRGKVHVRVRVEAEKVDDRLVALMRDRVRTMLRADLDLTEFYALAAEHESLASITRIGAGRLLRNASMAENIIKAICGTNVNWVQAVKMINRVGQLGPCIANFRNLNAWPTPSEILSAGDDFLRNVARLGYRSEAILKFCREVDDGTFDADGLDAFARSAPTDELYKRLLSIRGVGPATAGFLLGLLGHYDRLSIDSWTMAYVSKRHFNGRKVTTKQIERHYAPYGRWKQLAWWFEQWQTWATAQSMLH